MPFHVWLPVAHPAAPSPVSAIMSGVMIKTGIYGLIRTLTFLGIPPLWWGYLILALGIVSGVLGVLFALAQHDLKRLLAYHSVENIGIIIDWFWRRHDRLEFGHAACGGSGICRRTSACRQSCSFQGLAFPGRRFCLFTAPITWKLTIWAGLIKKMPYTGMFFLIGAVAISGLPPLNGFVSEFVIYIASFSGAISMNPYSSLSLIGAIAGLALIGGLAAACFTKAFGIVFLGEPRSKDAQNAHESSPWMTIPMMILAAACILIGLLGAAIILVISPVIGVVLGNPYTGEIRIASNYLLYVTAGSIVFIICLLAIAGLRWLLLSKRSSGQVWNLGLRLRRPYGENAVYGIIFCPADHRSLSVFLKNEKEYYDVRFIFPCGGEF